MRYTPGGSRAAVRLVSSRSPEPLACAKALLESEMAFSEFFHPMRDRLSSAWAASGWLESRTARPLSCTGTR